MCKNFEIKMSELQVESLDYNIANKHLKINISLPEYDGHKYFDNLKDNIEWIIIQIIGEITFLNNIKEI